ncbi:MAG: M23 family metallopeptidase [Ascidiaceihabitans sp.]|jgi:murein DD-endopeptidase MepM/ murein hydrolase activator NlpD|nr:M23 family metallopeptidase [Ascidiaceihabitans sp.]
MSILPHLASTRARILMASVALSALTACGDQPFDVDFRGLTGGFSTAEAAVNATTDRPKADTRGVISYPNYQVVVANRGDTLNDVAKRLDIDPVELSKFNGVGADVPLRKGEIIALPNRVTEPSALTGLSSEPVDVTALAGNAINNSPDTTPVTTAELPASGTSTPTGVEPIRHKVERGETAFTVARLYQVSAKSLAEWNGLGSDFAVREGQFLLIPVAKQNPPSKQTEQAKVEAPGEGTLTPTPPSAATPLPKNDVEAPATQTAAKAAEPVKPVADVGKQSAPAKVAKMTYPVSGSIIRAYSKGKNEGINIKGGAGTAVKAADGGSVAAITKSGDGVPIIVVRHPDNLLTVYANVTDVKVQKGDSVRRGQAIASLRTGDDAYVHFEVRNGFDSVDPLPFLQ